jgi:predicted nucleic acid-binding protein
MPAVAVYDANVLYPNTLRDLLIRLARAGVVRARWTDRILEEMLGALQRTRPDIECAKLDRLRHRMNDAVRDCLITDFEQHIAALELPDPNDRHVLAAAIHGSADLIVTWNLRDFPSKILVNHDIQARTPDDFVHGLIAPDDATVFTCVQQIADARHLRPQTADDILNQLERDGLIRSVAALKSTGRLSGG